MRLAAAIGVIAVTLAAAVYVHQRHVAPYYRSITGSGGTIFVPHPHPTWEDPVAVLLALGGIAIAVGIVASGRRSTKLP